MTKKTKKHGNVGNDHALRGDYCTDLTIRLTKDQDNHIKTKAETAKTSRSGAVRELIDNDMKQDKNK